LARYRAIIGIQKHEASKHESHGTLFTQGKNHRFMIVYDSQNLSELKECVSSHFDINIQLLGFALSGQQQPTRKLSIESAIKKHNHSGSYNSKVPKFQPKAHRTRRP